MFSPSWGLLFAAGALIAIVLFSIGPNKNSVVDYVFIWKEAEKGNIEWVEFQGDTLKGALEEGPRFTR